MEQQETEHAQIQQSVPSVVDDTAQKIATDQPAPTPHNPVKCHECGFCVDHVTEEMYEVGDKPGIPCCLKCGTSLLVLFPTECPACGYFLKKPNATKAGATLPLCAKCRRPLSLKSLEQLETDAIHSTEISEVMSAPALVEPKEPFNWKIGAAAAFAILAAVIVLSWELIPGQQAAPPLASVSGPKTGPDERDVRLQTLQAALSSQQAELDRLMAQRKQQGDNQALAQQIANQQELLRRTETQTQAVPQYSAPPQYPEPAQNSAPPQYEPPRPAAPAVSEPPTQPAQEAGPKSAADSYLDTGQSIKPKKSGG